ncbi:uncharacterized protein RCC_03725 [Ramularia collo-cygni]|uniref:Uncharacterized protein n=1 Tax=Ramularia collo-cygni TaxID=112498 RepID=A0A2D3USR1_9PEZI|nr:uncharacterized protein RCC_03725 [Ramularia collo-cygni]CZT17888.1 uncharacterized protein RCC_03725 [Ramularia collo-cygni]
MAPRRAAREATAPEQRYEEERVEELPNHDVEEVAAVEPIQPTLDEDTIDYGEIERDKEETANKIIQRLEGEKQALQQQETIR